MNEVILMQYHAPVDHKNWDNKKNFTLIVLEMEKFCFTMQYPRQNELGGMVNSVDADQVPRL